MHYFHATPQVGTLEPHHSVTFRYPAIELCSEDEGERWTLYKPVEDAKDRYNPLEPLGPNPVVQAHERLNAAETAFQSLYPARLELRAEITEDLVSDMESVCSTYGETELAAVIFQLNGETLIRLMRTSTTRTFGGVLHREPPMEYTFSPWQFLSAYRSYEDDERPCWLADLLELIHGQSDRALRAIHCAHDGHFDLANEWKTSRGRNIEASLAAISTPLTLQQLDAHHATLPESERVSDCVVCRVPFDEDSQIIMLHCPKRHVIDKECFLSWLEHANTAEAKCLLCQVPLNIPLVANHLDIDALFHIDPLYTRFENWERDCADLDRTRAVDCHTEVAPDYRTLERTYEFMCKMPHKLGHLPIFPEHEVIDWAFLKIAFELTREADPIPVSSLYKTLYDGMQEALRDEFCLAGLQTYYDQEFNDRLRVEPSLVPKRQGVEEDLVRVLNRVCVFLLVRKCDGTGQAEGCGFSESSVDNFHKHGNRFFYAT